MKKFFVITQIIILCSVFAGIKEDIVGSWADRDTFSVKFTRTDFSLIDTISYEGIFAVRKPDTIYKTSEEFVLFKDGFIWTFSEGSDVGMKSRTQGYEYADINLLLAKLDEDFDVEYSKKSKSFTMIGENGKGNIVSFSAELDKTFLPTLVEWTDIFGYKTRISFKKFVFKNPGNIFNPPENIEFIEQ